MKKRSWKTTLAGTLTSTGVVLIGAGAIELLPPKVKTASIVIGFILTVAGTFIGGLVARDNDVTSEEAGAKTKE